jgi:IS30 family transposase
LLINSRTGPDATPDEIAHIASIAAPLLENGQSPAQIWFEHSDEMPCSQRSFYRYTHANIFDDILAINLPSAVRYKARSHKNKASKTNISKACLAGRTYQDFLDLPDETRADTAEVDCVCGLVSDTKAILTILWRAWHFQMMLLLERKNTTHVIAAFDDVERALWIGYPELSCFPDPLLCDRGVEFACASGIEQSCLYGGGFVRTSLFYCDPMRSDQKALCENNHRLIRRIIPKGTSLDGLTAEDMAKVMSHINSMPRASLGGKAPISLAKGNLPEKLFETFKIEFILSDEIILKPKLLGLSK